MKDEGRKAGRKGMRKEGRTLRTGVRQDGN